MLKTLIYGGVGALGSGLATFIGTAAVAGATGVIEFSTAIYLTEGAIVLGGAIGAYKGHQADKRASEEKAPEHEPARELEEHKRKFEEWMAEKYPGKHLVDMSSMERAEVYGAWLNSPSNPLEMTNAMKTAIMTEIETKSVRTREQFHGLVKRIYLEYH